MSVTDAVKEWSDGWYYYWAYITATLQDKLDTVKRVISKIWEFILQSWVAKKVVSAASMSEGSKVYILILLSCLFFSLCSLFTELIYDMPVIEILWWRFFFTLAFTTFVNVYQDYPSPFTYKNYRMIMLTAVLGTLTAISTVFALRHLPIGEATLLLTTAPIFTVILSNVFLKEKLVVLDILALILATVGVFFVAQPSFIFGSTDMIVKTPIFYVSIMVALGRGFLKAAKYVAVSCAGVEVPTSVIVMSLSCLGFLVSTFFLIIAVSVEMLTDGDMKKAWVQPSILNFTYLVIVGASYCLQQASVCAAMQYGQPGKTSLLKYLDVVLPFMFQVLIFRELPDIYTLVGSGCIAVSTITVILVKRVKPIKHVTFKDELEDTELASTPQGTLELESEI